MLTHLNIMMILYVIRPSTCVEYSIGNGKKAYKDAKSACESKGMTLAMGVTQEEADDLLGFFTEHKEELFAHEIKKLGIKIYAAWIGLDDLAEKGTLKWNDGSAYEGTLTSIYDKTVEDNCKKGYLGSQCCIQLYVSLIGKGAAGSECHGTSPYLCQPDTDNYTVYIVIAAVAVLLVIVALGVALFFYRKKQLKEEQARMDEINAIEMQLALEEEQAAEAMEAQALAMEEGYQAQSAELEERMQELEAKVRRQRRQSRKRHHGHHRHSHRRRH